MRLRTLALVGLVVAIFVLAIPVISYGNYTREGTREVTVNFTAYCASATAKPSFTIDFDTDMSGSKVTYLDYIGIFWADVFHTASYQIPYPCVSIVIQDTTTGKRLVEDYFPYAWGEQFAKDYTVYRDSDTRLLAQVQIYKAQGSSLGYLSQYYEVP